MPIAMTPFSSQAPQLHLKPKVPGLGSSPGPASHDLGDTQQVTEPSISLVISQLESITVPIGSAPERTW